MAIKVAHSAAPKRRALHPPLFETNLRLCSLFCALFASIYPPVFPRSLVPSLPNFYFYAVALLKHSARSEKETREVVDSTRTLSLSVVRESRRRVIRGLPTTGKIGKNQTGLAGRVLSFPGCNISSSDAQDACARARRDSLGWQRPLSSADEDNFHVAFTLRRPLFGNSHLVFWADARLERPRRCYLRRVRSSANFPAFSSVR